MSPVERREAERRIKALLFASMVGVLVGLIVATVIESEQPPLPLLNDQLSAPHDTIDRTTNHKEEKHA